LAVCGLCRDPERAPNLFGLQAARERADDLGLALCQPGGPHEARGAVAGRFEHRGDGVGIEPPRAGLLAERLGGPLRRERLAVRPRLGHRVERVSGGKQAGGRRESSCRRSAMVARAVETLVVAGGNRRESGEKG